VIITMPEIRRFFNLAVVVPVLALCSFSPALLAWKGATESPWVGKMLNGAKCDGGQVPFGPFDYLQRNKFPAQLEVVEETHFTEGIENLTMGQTTTPMGDIHYTLQTWPNHHRALNSATRFRLAHRELWSITPTQSQGYPAECYLQRAINFRPKDPVPYMLLGMLMHKMKQYDKALKAYRGAVELLPDDILTQYNMGLALAELKKYKEAAKVARKVYAAGYPLPGLKRKLIAAGYWKAEPKAAGTKTDTSPVAAAKTKVGEKNSTEPATKTPELTEEQLTTIKEAMLHPAGEKPDPKEPDPQ
jgi:hypothetical protein